MIYIADSVAQHEILGDGIGWAVFFAEMVRFSSLR